jgi:DNA-directed RNA polymerase alpha subunit
MRKEKKIRFIKTDDRDYKKLLHEYALLQEEHNKLKGEVEENLKAWDEISKLLHKRHDLIEEVEQLTHIRNTQISLLKMIPVHELEISDRLKAFLKNNSIICVNQEDCMQVHPIKEFRNFGRQSSEELKMAIVKYHSDD